MELHAVLIIATTLIGFCSLSRSIVGLFWFIWVTFLRPPKNLTHYGSWAIITGSTGGIGKALSFELASKGLNLFLIDRELSVLEQLSDAIREKFASSIEVKCLAMDFLVDKNVDVVKKIEESIYGLDVGVLINNAGVNHRFPKYIHEVESSLVDNVIGVNLDGLTWMTKAVLPVMLKKRKGCIINMGSTAAALPSFPLATLYSATKAYVKMFSKSLSLECQKQGIAIQCQEPLFIHTKLTPLRRSSFFVPSPEMHTRAAIRWFGYAHNCRPYWTHSLAWWIVSAVPDELVSSIILHYILVIRKKLSSRERRQNVQ